jgi:hypothetical protein
MLARVSCATDEDESDDDIRELIQQVMRLLLTHHGSAYIRPYVAMKHGSNALYFINSLLTEAGQSQILTDFGQMFISE